MNTVPFEVVEIWYNDIYTPFTLKPTRKDSECEYAIRIGDDFFHLGKPGMGIHICDLDDELKRVA